MIPRHGRFTINKQIVRDLQRDCIRSCLSDRLGNLGYFGLCSPEMKDIIDWADLLARVVAVERGEKRKGHIDQHKLRLTATRHGFQNKLRLLCGDIDYVILDGEDEHKNQVPYPFDIVSLDYSGGLFYQDEANGLYRLEAIKKVVEKQASSRRTYVLFISANSHAMETGEIKRAINSMRTALNRHGWNADHVCDAYLNHCDGRARLKLYLPLFISQEAAANSYSSQTLPVILYEGNRGIPMLNFRFVLKPCQTTKVRRFPLERISQILNTPFVRIADGRKTNTTLGLPKLTTNDVR